jgi:ubiquinone/menaquinone biosynthesis C-methylase UbiE
MKKTIILLLILLIVNNLYAQKQKCPCTNYSSDKNNYLAVIQKTIIGANKIKSKENVLSVGVGDGWREFEYSLTFDSVNFFLEDIDTTCLTKEQLAIDKAKYSAIRGKDITCNFSTVKGTEKTIEYSDTAFDRVLIIHAWHEMTYYHEMVKECCRVLKSGGSLSIAEWVIEGKYKKGCPHATHVYLTEPLFIKEIESCGFKFQKDFSISDNYKVFNFIKN